MQIAAPLNNEATPGLQWIEVASSLQIPNFQIIGLPAPEVAEARERVKAAIDASGFEFPRRRVVINLSPASVRKRGTGLDLGIALAILLSERDLPPERGLVAAWGELGLDGTVKPAAQLTRAIYAAWQGGVPLILVSEADLESAEQSRELLTRSRLLNGPAPEIAGVPHLAQAWEAIRNPKAAPRRRSSSMAPAAPGARVPEPCAALLPLSPSLERAVGVAAAGSHHLLLLGPRGAGKSHAIEWLIALQPPPEAVTRVRQALLAELTDPRAGSAASTDARAPVRRISPHARPGALIGGASEGAIRPGEFSLAHGGLLVADELPEWSRDARETLREPMERGSVTLTRTLGNVELPARFILAANGNLCPCGGWPPQFPLPAESRGLRVPRCRCTHTAREHYLARLSGPVLDRLDLVCLVSATPSRGKRKEARQPASRETYAELRERVIAARERAVRDWGSPSGFLAAEELEEQLSSRPEWRAWLDSSQALSLRARHKILRVALTLASWDGTSPGAAHFAEAAFYRPERYGLAT